jgi:hypothetical protein
MSEPKEREKPDIVKGCDRIANDKKNGTEEHLTKNNCAEKKEVNWDRKGESLGPSPNKSDQTRIKNRPK